MYLKTLFIKLIYVTAIITYLSACNNSQTQKGAGQTHLDTLPVTNESIKNLSTQIESEPENAELYYQRAVIYYTEKYLDRSLMDITDALKYDPKNPLYFYFKGRILYSMNKTQDAANAYESAIVLKPDYTEAQMKLAELYYVVKEHQKSINLLNVILVAEPTNANAYYLKGDNQRESNDTAKAIASYQKALEIDDKFYDAAMQLGLIMTAKRNPIGKEYFTTAIRINPRSAEAYFGRAFFYQQIGELQKALFDYRKVITLDPTNDKSYYNVGMINFNAKKYAEALRSWDICIQMNTENMEAYYMRGLVHEYKRNKTDALLNYEYALKLNPNYELAKEGIERLK